jgi:hypothetical protein
MKRCISWQGAAKTLHHLAKTSSLAKMAKNWQTSGELMARNLYYMSLFRKRNMGTWLENRPEQ